MRASAKELPCWKMLDLTSLNAFQKKAVCHFNGPAMVLAGPGSGKTTVLTKHIQYLIEIQHVPPEEILVVTFTKAAALEMQQRFGGLMGERLPVSFGTFHSVYYHILKESGAYCASDFITPKEKKKYLAEAWKNCRQEEKTDLHNIEHLLAAFGLCKNLGALPDAARFSEQSAFAGLSMSHEDFCALYRQYEARRLRRRKLDFDDIVPECAALFEKRPEILRGWQKRFRYLLVDEFQDIAPAQYVLLQKLALPENNLFIVGDDDQSIYGFRGAGSDIMLSFPREYPQAECMELAVNYRSAPDVILAASLVIEENKNRFAKRQHPAPQKPAAGIEGQKEEKGGAVVCRAFAKREDEYQAMLEDIRVCRKRKQLCQTAVIFRKNRDADFLSALLVREGIPYERKEKGQSLYDQPLVKDVFSYLRLAAGTGVREDFLRIMNKPCRGLSRELCWGEAAEGGEGEAPVRKGAAFSWHLIKENCQSDGMRLVNVKKLQEDLRRVAGMKPYAAIVYIRNAIGYERYLEKEVVRGSAFLRERQRETLMELQEEAGNFYSFLEWEKYVKEREAAKAYEEKQQFRGIPNKPQEDRLQIMTMHASKGLEFERVYLPDLQEGIVPHKKAVSEAAVEEERRMLYVGMTRARKRLYLYYVEEKEQKPSRFLAPLLNARSSAFLRSNKMKHDETRDETYEKKK